MGNIIKQKSETNGAEEVGKQGYYDKCAINHVAPKTKVGAAGLGRKMMVQLCCGLVFDVPLLDKLQKYRPQIGTRILGAITETGRKSHDATVQVQSCQRSATVCAGSVLKMNFSAFVTLKMNILVVLK